MTPEQFCYWLKGFFELSAVGPKNPELPCMTYGQTQMIEKHLKSVFAEKIMLPYQADPITFPKDTQITCSGISSVSSSKPSEFIC